MNNVILWARTRPEAVIPTKRDEDGGYDCYACLDKGYEIIYPSNTEMIGLGVASAFPEDYVMFLKERGSTAKYGLSIRSGVIDSGYRGEYIACFTNTLPVPIVLVDEEKFEVVWDEKRSDLATTLHRKTDKLEEFESILLNRKSLVYPISKAICQAVLLPLPKLQSKEVPYEELLEIKSERGTGLMGSSGK